MSGKDPLMCENCGREMDLWEIWHPVYGTIFDEYKNLKAGKYGVYVENKEEVSREDNSRGYSLWPSAGGVQFPLFPLRI